jgi:hypothetical protein
MAANGMPEPSKNLKFTDLCVCLLKIEQYYMEQSVAHRGGRGEFEGCAPPPPRRVCNFGVKVWGVQKHKSLPVIAPKNGKFFEFALDRMRF